MNQPVKKYGDGKVEDKRYCTEEVFSPEPKAPLNGRQCRSFRGHGPNGEYCAFHARNNKGIRPFYD